MKSSETKLLNGHEYFETGHLRSGLKKRAAKGAGAVVFSQISTYSIQMISTIVLARILTPDDFGLVAMVTSISMFFKMYRNLGLTQATVQREEINHKQISTLFWINLVFSLIITLILIGLAPVIGWFYGEPKLEAIAIILSSTFILGGGATQHLALLKRRMLFYRIAVNEIVGTIISVIVAVAMAWTGWGYWALIARRLSQELFVAVGAWIICRWRPGLPSYGTGVRPMLKFGISSLGADTVSYFSRNLDKILIGWRYGAQSLGFYDRAFYLFAAPSQQLSVPLTSVGVSTLSKLCNDPEKYRRYYLNAVSMLAFSGMLISAVLTLIGKDFILVLLGAQWGNAGQIFSFFGPAIGIMLVYNTHRWLHLSLGRADRLFFWSIISSIVTIIFFILGLSYGPLGVAISYTLSLYILIAPSLWYAGKPINLRLLSIVSVVWRYFLSAVCSGLFCWFILYSFGVTSNYFISLNIFVRLAISIIFCIFVYLLLVVALYKNIKPILQFISFCKEMLPQVSLKKQKTK